MAGLSVDRGTRAQLLLVGAFGIAVLLLVLAGVLNAVTYTESLAKQDDGIHDGRDVEAFQADTRAAVRGIVTRVNGENGTVTEQTTRVERSVTNWSAAASQEQAVDVTAVNVTVLNTTVVSNVTQTVERNYTNATGEPGWTLAGNVSNVREFTLNLSSSSLASGDCTGNASCFTVVVENGTETWTAQVNDSAVFVEAPNTTTTCAFSADPVRIDLTNGTVNGTDCAGLDVTSELSGEYEIRYGNGTDAAGTYQLTVEGDPAYTNYADTGDPSVSTIVETVTLQVTYRTPRVEYRTVIRVRGGGPDG